MIFTTKEICETREIFPEKIKWIQYDELIDLINQTIKESPNNDFNWGLVVLKEKLNNR